MLVLALEVLSFKMLNYMPICRGNKTNTTCMTNLLKVRNKDPQLQVCVWEKTNLTKKNILKTFEKVLHHVIHK